MFLLTKYKSKRNYDFYFLQGSNAFLEMPSSAGDMKLRPFGTSLKDQGVEDPIVGDSYHLSSSDDLRLGQQQSNSYHIGNTSNNKDW